MAKLIEVVISEDKPYHFIFEGKMSKDEDETIGYSFSDIQIFEMVGGNKVPFEVDGKTWAGDDVDEEYALADVISRYTRAALSAEFLYMAPRLKKALKPYTEDMELSAVHRISPKVLYDSLEDEYAIALVTDEYAYYCADGDAYLMLETATGEVVADNYFAESGYSDSEDNLETGEEILLYQEYEFSVEGYVANMLKYIRDNDFSEFSYRCLYGEAGQCETIYMEGTLDPKGLATFRIERMLPDGHRCSEIPVFEMPLTDKAIEQVAKRAKENL